MVRKSNFKLPYTLFVVLYVCIISILKGFFCEIWVLGDNRWVFKPFLALNWKYCGPKKEIVEIVVVVGHEYCENPEIFLPLFKHLSKLHFEVLSTTGEVNKTGKYSAESYSSVISLFCEFHLKINKLHCINWYSNSNPSAAVLRVLTGCANDDS